MFDFVLRRCDVEVLLKIGWEICFEFLNVNDLDVRLEVISFQYGVENFFLNIIEYFGLVGLSVF